MISGEGENIGALILVEDISSEKRVRSTMSRYMDPQLANQLLEEGDGQAMLGGKAAEATVLFTDIELHNNSRSAWASRYSIHVK